MACERACVSCHIVGLRALTGCDSSQFFPVTKMRTMTMVAMQRFCAATGLPAPVDKSKEGQQQAAGLIVRATGNAPWTIVLFDNLPDGVRPAWASAWRLVWRAMLWANTAESQQRLLDLLVVGTELTHVEVRKGLRWNVVFAAGRMCRRDDMRLRIICDLRHAYVAEMCVFAVALRMCAAMLLAVCCDGPGLQAGISE